MKKFLTIFTLVSLMIACNNAQENNTPENNTQESGTRENAAPENNATDSVVVDTAPVAPATGSIDNTAVRQDSSRERMKRAVKK